MASQLFTAMDLRQIVAEVIAPTIQVHRDARAKTEFGYSPPNGEPTDEEVDDFLCHNQRLEEETVSQLTDPGLLGFFAKTARANQEWIDGFRQRLVDWARGEEWLSGRLPWREQFRAPAPVESELWTPSTSAAPLWLNVTPSYVLIAFELVQKGKLLSELPWRQFEQLIAQLLEGDGWQVTLTQATRDGGVDVLATKLDQVLGEIRTAWQAKKYGPRNKVRLAEVRELSAVREELRASKAVVVTTSHLTRDALAWVRRDVYRLGYKEHDDLLRWIRGSVLGSDPKPG
jgi:hypothetical protein